MHNLKQSILIALLLCLPTWVGAQRYLQPVFDSVLVINDIPFGSNLTYKGDTQTLYMDVYMPYADTQSLRPTLILAHGGSFAQGSRKATDISTVCKGMALRGCVCISIDYRLGADILSGQPLEQEFQQAVWKATQDHRAAVRFINKSIANGNPYKADPANLFAGGISAGGVMGLHLAFMDLPQEVAQTVIDTTQTGGIEGNSGNAGYSWRVKGVIALCAAMGETGWMSNNKNVSLCLMHGDADMTVPYKTDEYKFLGAPVMRVQGSWSIDSAATQMKTDHKLYTFYGAGHVPFTGSSAAQMAYMDTTLTFIGKYLYRSVTGKVPDALAETDAERVFVYPNPATDFIEVNGLNKDYTLTLQNLQGSVVEEFTAGYQTNISHLPAGIYLLTIQHKDALYTFKLLKY